MGTAQAWGERPLESTYSPAYSLDLRSLLGPLQRGSGDPTTRWYDGAWWRAQHTPGGPGTLSLRPTPAGVACAAWGPGAEWLIDAVPALLGAHDRPEDLDHRGHPLLTAALQARPHHRLGRTGLVFDQLVPAVLEQKVTGAEAKRSFRELVTWHGPPAPGPLRLRVCPPAAVWQRIPSWDFHRAGVGPQRSKAIVTAARVADRLQQTAELHPGGGPAADARLRSVPGIGVWTSAEVRQRAHGDPDALSVGDYHLADFVGRALTGRPVDDPGMEELLEPWRGQRHRVVCLLFTSAPAKPRFGPRMSVRDYRSL